METEDHASDYFYDDDFHMEQYAKLQREKFKCLLSMNDSETPSNETYCPSVWDGAYCWPPTPPGTASVVPCPSYIHGFSIKGSASRICTSGGTWWWNEKSNGTWSNYTLCEANSAKDIETSYFQLHLPIIKLISHVGYSISLFVLLVAFLTLALIKKLRCPRNSLHMQLFFSFIMRALLSLLRDVLVFQDASANKASTYISNDIACKIFMSFWQYFLMANYYWILMEGMYLHNLIFLSMFTDASSIVKYVIFGWGFPVIFVISWVIIKATLEDTLCWTVNENVAFFWIIRGPITVSIVVNFVFFINITRVLFLKMFSSQAIQSRRYRYRKWFKSTLVLVPLFGVHYALLLSINLAASMSETIELIWLYIDQTFSSFQGSFVALLYCFMNGEVQSEMQKLWRMFRPKSERQKHHSFLTQSLTFVSRARSSIQSLHSTGGDRVENSRSGDSHIVAVMTTAEREFSTHPSSAREPYNFCLMEKRCSFVCNCEPRNDPNGFALNKDDCCVEYYDSLLQHHHRSISHNESESKTHSRKTSEPQESKL